MIYLIVAVILCFVSVRCLCRSYLIWVRNELDLKGSVVTRIVSILYAVAGLEAAVLAYYVVLEWI